MACIGLLLLFALQSNYGNCQIRKAKRHYELGALLLNQGNYEESIENFSAAIKIKASKDAYFNRAIAYSKLNMHKERCDDLLRSAALNDKEAKKLYASKCIMVDTLHDISDNSRDNSYMVRKQYNYKDLKSFRQFDDRDSCVLSYSESRGVRSYEILENYAQFAGGLDVLDSFVYHTIEYSANSTLAGIEGTVVANFIIDEDGNLRSIEFAESASRRLENAVLTVLEAMPEWEPATYNNRFVRNTIYCLFVFGTNVIPGYSQFLYDSYKLEINDFDAAQFSIKWYFSGQFPNNLR